MRILKFIHGCNILSFLIFFQLSLSFGFVAADENCTPATFQVDGNRVIMNGEILTDTEVLLFSVLENNPQVDTLVLQNVPGSCDDRAMIQLGKRVYNTGLKTLLPSNGYVGSGGSDLLMAGRKRYVDNNGCIGVHSWCCDDRTSHVASLPTNDSVHQKYIDFYKAVGYTPEEAANLYWFTITVASSQGMHYLTPAEIEKLGFEYITSPAGKCNRPDEGGDDGSFDFAIPASIPRVLGLPISTETLDPTRAPTSMPVPMPDNDEPIDDDDEPMDEDDGDWW